MGFNYFWKTRERLTQTGFQVPLHVQLVDFHMSYREKTENVTYVMNFCMVFPTETTCPFHKWCHV